MVKEFVDELCEEARAQLGEIRRYRLDRVTAVDEVRRAKLAIGVIGAYVRLRATMANERSNYLIEARLLAQKSLPPASEG